MSGKLNSILSNLQLHLNTENANTEIEQLISQLKQTLTYKQSDSVFIKRFIIYSINYLTPIGYLESDYSVENAFMNDEQLIKRNYTLEALNNIYNEFIKHYGLADIKLLSVNDKFTTEHLKAQDVSSTEKGGINTPEEFESGLKYNSLRLIAEGLKNADPRAFTELSIGFVGYIADHPRDVALVYH